MTHNPRHDEDFSEYAKMRNRAFRNIAMIQAFLTQYKQAIREMPATNDAAGYLDLDNLEQLSGEVQDACDILCTDSAWETFFHYQADEPNREELIS